MRAYVLGEGGAHISCGRYYFDEHLIEAVKELCIKFPRSNWGKLGGRLIDSIGQLTRIYQIQPKEDEKKDSLVETFLNITVEFPLGRRLSSKNYYKFHFYGGFLDKYLIALDEVNDYYTIDIDIKEIFRTGAFQNRLEIMIQSYIHISDTPSALLIISLSMLYIKYFKRHDGTFVRIKDGWDR